jgi:acetoin utilization protein AcuB
MRRTVKRSKRRRLVSEEPAIRAGELLTLAVASVWGDTTAATAWNIMRRRRIRHLPVLDSERRLIGILSERDLRAAILRVIHEVPRRGIDAVLARTRVNEVMTWGVITVGRDTNIRDAAAILVQRNVGALPVVESGRVVGMLTATDVIAAALRQAAR